MASKSFEKLIEEIGNMSVIELADLVKALEEKFGVSAAMPASGAAPASSCSWQLQQQKKKQNIK